MENKKQKNPVVSPLATRAGTRYSPPPSPDSSTAAAGRRPKAEEEWPGSSDRPDTPGPMQGQCQRAQRQEQPGPWPPPSPPSPLLWARGRPPGPPVLSCRCDPDPRTGWGREGGTEPTVHWAPRLFRSSPKGKGALLGVLPSEWGPKLRSLGLSPNFWSELCPLEMVSGSPDSGDL